MVSSPRPGPRPGPGVPYTLSTMSSRSIEEVRAVSDGRLWFQVYAWRDRGLVKEMVDRAQAAGFEALVLTVDTAVLGRRERDVRRGFSMPPSIGLGTIVDGALHPGWTWSFVRSEPVRFANVTGSGVADGSTPGRHLGVHPRAVRPRPLLGRRRLAAVDLGRARSLVKGIGRVEDAVRAAEVGVDAVVLSNHGGRQLDGAPATFSLLPAVADALDGRTEIICDGGIRRGSDVLKAVAAGATAAMAGRAYLWGLAAAGELGVQRVLEWFHADMVRTMSLLGVTSRRPARPLAARLGLTRPVRAGHRRARNGAWGRAEGRRGHASPRISPTAAPLEPIGGNRSRKP